MIFRVISPCWHGDCLVQGQTIGRTRHQVLRVSEGLGAHINNRGTNPVLYQGQGPGRQTAMISKLASLKLRSDEGFSLIELLIVVAIIGIIAAIAVPQLMNAMDRGRQRRSMADMRNIATANGTYRVDSGIYATALTGLVPAYMQVAPANDGWGAAYVYTTGADTYTITSLGSNSAAGPAPPVPWINDPYDPDITLTDGQFIQAPTGQ